MEPKERKAVMVAGIPVYLDELKEEDVDRMTEDELDNALATIAEDPPGAEVLRVLLTDIRNPEGGN